MIKKLIAWFKQGGELGAPVHVGANPVYFTYLYSYRRPNDVIDTWVFSWHTENHSEGGQEDYISKIYAETQRDGWEKNKKWAEHASIVRG